MTQTPQNRRLSNPDVQDFSNGVLVRKFDATPEEVAEAPQIIRVAARTVRPSVQLHVKGRPGW
jgi:hypothetical protein